MKTHLRLRAAFLFILLCIPLLNSEAAEKRSALIIGNSSYPNAPLKNPVNDAKDMAEALSRVGFKVNLLLDADITKMTRAIRDFGNEIKDPQAVGLFYYSGHGVQVKGTNYLIPANADIQSADEISFQAVNADQILVKMESAGNKTNIVILDACRNNPFPGAERSTERGLAISATQPPGSIVIYSTAPGKTASDGSERNGVFTKSILKYIDKPGLDIEMMMRQVRDEVVKETAGSQVPWSNSSLTKSGFAFVQTAASFDSGGQGFGTLEYSLPEGIAVELIGQGFSTQLKGKGLIADFPAAVYAMKPLDPDWIANVQTITVVKSIAVSLKPTFSRTEAWYRGQFESRTGEIEKRLKSTEKLDEAIPAMIGGLRTETGKAAYPFKDIEDKLTGFEKRYASLKLILPRFGDLEKALPAEEALLWEGFRTAIGVKNEIEKLGEDKADLSPRIDAALAKWETALLAALSSRTEQKLTEDNKTMKAQVDQAFSEKLGSIAEAVNGDEKKVQELLDSLGIIQSDFDSLIKGLQGKKRSNANLEQLKKLTEERNALSLQYDEAQERRATMDTWANNFLLIGLTGVGSSLLLAFATNGQSPLYPVFLAIGAISAATSPVVSLFGGDPEPLRVSLSKMDRELADLRVRIEE